MIRRDVLPATKGDRLLVAEGRFDGVACRGARTMLGLTQTELCSHAKVGRNTLNDFEMLSREPRASNVDKIKKALESLGADFPDLGDGTVVVRVRREGRQAFELGTT